MLLSLNIRDFVIVSQLDLECDAGLTVLSGETGAGKSILIDALALCMGERADAGFVREGADAARITAVFDPPPAAQALLVANDLPSHELIIRRTVQRNGKSRALVNEVPVTATLLKSLADCLIDIHGQHAFQSLVRAEEQRRLLDTHAGLLDAARTVRDAWKTLKTAESDLSQARQVQTQLASERERLAWQLEEIDRINPTAGQWESLCQQHDRLSHAAELLDGLQSCIAALDEADESVGSQLSGISNTLGQLARRDAALEPFVKQVEAACIEVQEASRGLSAYLRRVDLDPDRLSEVDAQLSQWHGVSRKLRIQPEEMAQRSLEIRQQLSELDRQADLQGLEKAVERALAEFTEQAVALRKKRVQAAKALSKAVTQSMQGLNLTGGVFVVDVRDADGHAGGLDTIEFLVSGHAGSTPKPLTKVASGGELARISLAIAVITSQSTTIPTLIFDEVDSGIGGAVAQTVGQYLRQLGTQRQVLCVTHLPQVASQGHHHWQVSKQFDGAATTSRIRVLTEDERVQEIARMLGGANITASTLAAAKDLLVSQ